MARGENTSTGIECFESFLQKHRAKIESFTYQDGYQRGLEGNNLTHIDFNFGCPPQEYFEGVRDGYREFQESQRRNAWNEITGLIEAARPELV